MNSVFKFGKSKQTLLRRVFVLYLCLIIAPVAHAQDEPLPPPPQDEATLNAQPPVQKVENKASNALPDIEARSFQVRVARKSNSDRIYLFDDIENHQTNPGRIVLLKKNDEPIMAFRAMKNYPDQKQFAAKRVKRYGNHFTLKISDTFTAIEKVSDIAFKPTAQDTAEMKELEARGANPPPAIKAPDPTAPTPTPQPSSAAPEEPKTEEPKTNAFDPELDAATTPHKSDSSAESSTGDQTLEEEEDTHVAVTIDEITPIDHNFNWLSFGFGFIRISQPPGASGTAVIAAGSIKYAYSVAKLVFFDRNHLQDSFALEAGLLPYKVINYNEATPNDAYLVLGTSATLRYNLLFSEGLGVFAYGGITKGWVVSATNADSGGTSVDRLNSIIPAFGAGILLQVGPSWYTRLDIGYDSYTLNLVLRF